MRTGSFASAPILMQIGGLLIASILAVTAISFAVVAFTPPPAEPRMSLAQVQRAVLSAEAASRSGLDRSVESDPLAKRSQSGELFEAALAHSLAMPREKVRVRLAPGSADGDDASIEVVSPASGPVRVSVTRDPQVLVGGEADKQLFEALLRPEFRVSAFEAAVQGSDGRWIVVRPETPWLSGWRLRLFAAFAISAICLSPLAWFAARKLTRPIRALAAFASRTDLHEPGAVATVGGPREVRAAATAIEEMRTRLHEQATERTRMLAAVAHDLRTPLTSLRIRAETAPEKERAKMAADIARMDAMIAQVLAYAAGEQSTGATAPLDLRTLVSECVARSEEQVRLVDCEAADPIAISGDLLAVERAVTNLIDNAIRYAGSAEVEVYEDGGLAVVSVSDRGPGLPEGLAEKVQEPFYRVENSRNRATGGTGLGLAIASGVAAKHGGCLELSNRPQGGLRAELRLRREPF